jgi:hypothetical protein
MRDGIAFIGTEWYSRIAPLGRDDMLQKPPLPKTHWPVPRRGGRGTGQQRSFVRPTSSPSRDP